MINLGYKTPNNSYGASENERFLMYVDQCVFDVCVCVCVCVCACVRVCACVCVLCTPASRRQRMLLRLSRVIGGLQCLPAGAPLEGPAGTTRSRDGRNG